MAFPFKNKQKQEQTQEQQEQIIQLDPLEQASLDYLQELNQNYSDNCNLVGDKERELSMLKEENKNLYIQASNLKMQLDSQFEKKYGRFKQGLNGALVKA